MQEKSMEPLRANTEPNTPQFKTGTHITPLNSDPTLCISHAEKIKEILQKFPMKDESAAEWLFTGVETLNNTIELQYM